MHPLMKLDEITGVYFPGFQSVFSRTGNTYFDLKNTNEVQEFVLNQPLGTAKMLFLRQIKEGKMSWTYRNGLLLKVILP